MEPPKPPFGIKRTRRFAISSGSQDKRLRLTSPDHSKRFRDTFYDQACYDFPLCDEYGNTIEYTINATQSNKLPNGTYNFVIRGNEEDTLYLIKLDDAMRTNLQRCSTKEPLPKEFPHTCLAGRKQGKDPHDYLVISAGEITVIGNDYIINNKSGHFKPHQDTLAYVEHLINKYFIGVKVTLSEDLQPNTNECLVNLGTEPEPNPGSKKKRKKKKHKKKKHSSKKRRRSRKRRKSKRRRKIPHKRKTMRGGVWRACDRSEKVSEEQALSSNFTDLIGRWKAAEDIVKAAVSADRVDSLFRESINTKLLLQAFRNSITEEGRCSDTWDGKKLEQINSDMDRLCKASDSCPPSLQKSIEMDEFGRRTDPPSQDLATDYRTIEVTCPPNLGAERVMVAEVGGGEAVELVGKKFRVTVPEGVDEGERFIFRINMDGSEVIYS